VVSCSTGQASCRSSLYLQQHWASRRIISHCSCSIMQVAFVQRVIDLLASRPDKMDQDAVLTALTNWNGPPLPLYIFPPHLVQNGWQVTNLLCSQSNPTTLTLIPFSVLRSKGTPRFINTQCPRIFLVSHPSRRWALHHTSCQSLCTTTGLTATRALTFKKCT
jgi:hypothetical protein